jgi:hypothetical protein
MQYEVLTLCKNFEFLESLTEAKASSFGIVASELLILKTFLTKKKIV